MRAGVIYGLAGCEAGLNTRALTTMCVFFVFTALATSGILRFLDDSPLIATLHMTFAFTMLAIIFLHISNNWLQLVRYLKQDRLELSIALLFLAAIGAVGYLVHHFSIGSEVV